ncbi:MAG: hypothetical protein U9Q94_01210 [Candidatus Bipolaricaulota bacterium]|nr:hypothetical protein [Candidatus Bipolaricaulota bacterium]
MTNRIVVVVAVVLSIVSLTLVASPLSGMWEANLAIDPSPFSFTDLSSTFGISYSVGGFTATSNSEFLLAGFIWQGFGVIGTLDAFTIQGDLLFGASTADFIYDQLIITTSIAGIDFALYWAQLSDAVLGGPADGSVLRMAGSIGDIDIVNCFELGAQVEDKDDDSFNGITIYHAATGAHRHYVTNPLVVGQGFTGEKIMISRWGFGCVEDIATTLYMTCHGFDYIKFALTGIETGIDWLKFDVDLMFQLQTKTLVLTPTLNLGENACIDLYSRVHTHPAAITSITGIEIYGLGFTTTLGNVTVKDLTVFSTSCYAITTEEYGSAIEEKADALKYGHDFYPDYWEMFSIEVTGDGCCGGSYTFLANTYFNKNVTSLFDWGMTHIEATMPINTDLFLNEEVEVDTIGVDHVGLGMSLSW